MTVLRLCPPPETAIEPSFLRALEVGFVARLIQEHLLDGATLEEIRPAYVRWKDRDGSLLGFQLQVKFGTESYGSYATVRTAMPARLASEAERINHRKDKVHLGVRSCCHLPEHGMLLVGYPLDRVMREMRHLVRASKVRGLVLDYCPEFVPSGLRISKANSRGSLISYRPERRAVVCWQVGMMDNQGTVQETKSVWLRCHAQPQATRSIAATREACAAGVRCPEALGIAHEQLYLERHVSGSAWQPLDATGRQGEPEKVAATIARLHGARPVSALPVHGPLAELDLALRSADDLCRLDRELGRGAQATVDRLAASVPRAARMVLSHGDLHPEQVLIDDDAALVDFDRACVAPVAHDLATLRANLIADHQLAGERAFGELLAAYGRFAQAPAAADMSWWTACALMRLAIRPFRCLHPDWQTAGARLIAAANAAATAVGEEGLA